MRRGQRQRLSLVQVGLIGLLAAVLLTYFGFTKAIPFRHHYEIKAAFKSANNLKPNTLVRVAGVNVGKVVKVEHSTPGDPEAMVTMRIDKKGLPLHDDATLTIRPRIFLEGNFFVDITPGSPSQPVVDDGDTIPVNQTNTPVQLDQILSTLQTDTRADLRTLLKEYSSALESDGAAGFNKSIPYWEPAYRDSSIVADAQRGLLEHDLSNYIKYAGSTAEALDRDPAALKALITDFDITANAFARQSDNLRAAVHELPRTLRAAQPALGNLNAAFPDLRGLARDLRPGVRSSEPAIDASIPFVSQLRQLVSKPELEGLVTDLKPTVPSLSKLNTGSVPLQRQVRLASSCQNDVVLPWSHDKVGDTAFPASGEVYQEAPKVLPGLAGESRSGDANGQWFRVLVSGGTNLITLKPGVFATNALPINGSNPRKPPARPPIDYSHPCETQQKPNLESIPGVAPQQKRIDTTTPEYKAAEAKAMDKAITWLRKQIKAEGLSDSLKVSDIPATKELLDKVKAQRDAIVAQTGLRARKAAGSK